jgi:hypothetical protein
MDLREISRQTIATLRAHKMRSFLTMFGIVWGIASVIILVGLGIGFSKDQKKRMETLGKDLVIVWGGRTSAQAGGLAAGRRITLTIDDARVVKDECYLLKAVSPELRRSVPEVSQFNSAARQVSGTWPSFQDFRSLILSEGRLMTEQDERDGNRVVILGWNAAQQLYPGQPAMGATLLIARYPYTVIGVLADKKQNSNYSGPDNDMLYVPYRSMARDFPPQPAPGETITKGYISNVLMEVGDPESHEEAVRQVRRVLGRLHHFEETDNDALFIWDTMKFSKLLARIFNVVDLLRLRGCDHAGSRRHRRNEHHAGGGHGAYSRDRYSEGDRRNQAGHPQTVLRRIDGCYRAQRSAGLQRGGWYLPADASGAPSRFCAETRGLAGRCDRISRDAFAHYGQCGNVSCASRLGTGADPVPPL